MTNRYTFSSIANYLAAKSGANPLAYSTYATVLGVPGLAYKSLVPGPLSCRIAGRSGPICW